MTYLATIVAACSLLAQPPGNGGIEPLRVPARPAPPAALGTAPTLAAPDAASDDPWSQQPAEPPDATAPEDGAMPDRYRVPREAAPARPPAQASEPAGGEMEDLGDTPRQKLRPPELIAEALETPRQEAISGVPLGLEQALARAADRQQQLKITQTYWRLATAQAEYHWALAQRDLMREHVEEAATPAGQGGTAVLAAQAAAEAEARDRQVAVEQVQQELADLLGSASMPLATDRPHVGGYRTDYEALFAHRLPPLRIRLIERTLPVRRKAIDARAEAVVAAVDALESASRQVREAGRGTGTLVQALELLAGQRRAFIADVRDYNLEIAEYAFAVAPAGAAGETLVSMLIRTSTPAIGTRLEPRRADPSATRKTFRAPPESGAAAAAPRSWLARYQRPPADDTGIYQGLWQLDSGPLRAQKLGNLLHWDRNLPTEAGEPVSLAACLKGVPVENRLAVIRAFWRVRQQAALYQLAAEHEGQLAALASIAIALREDGAIAEAGVRLHAGRCAARAAAFAAEAALWGAQFELMLALGRPADAPWPMPATVPQAGRYVTLATGAGGPRSDHWAGITSLEYSKVQHRANAVIQCDALRAELVARARRNDPAGEDDHLTALDRAVWATGRQNALTLDFLRDLTAYNMAIANYALFTLPGTVSGDALAGKLAIARSTRRDS